MMSLEVDGRTVRVSLAALSAALARASKPQRESYRISPAGYGIHWPLLDEDLSIDGILRVAMADRKPALAR
jgi:hypothetical protein